jgi:TatD DNase family protein
VSLNAADAETYARICPNPYGAAAWGAVKDFIRAAVRHIADVAVSCVALPGLSEEACRREAEALGARFRWRPYDRLGRIEGV